MTDLALRRARRSRLRAMALAAMLLLLAQAAIGMIVNLYVTIPVRHPGAHPSSYFTGSLQSIAWAVAHGPVALAVHAALGVMLVVIVITTAVVARRLGSRPVTACSTIAALLVIGAGFNGVSFLDFNDDTNSLIMALLAFAALACYSLLMFLLAGLPDGER